MHAPTHAIPHAIKNREVGQALYYLADLASIHGEYARSQALFEVALFLFRKIGNELWAGGTLVHSAVWLHFSLGNITTIRQRLQEGQALITKVGNRHWSAECSWLTALLALSEGEVARASSLTRESLAYYREIGDKTSHCAGELDYPFLKNDTQQESNQACLRRTGLSCLPVTLVILRIIGHPSVPVEYLCIFLVTLEPLF
jgi:hypothetical protein